MRNIKKKPILLYDGTLLANEFSRSNSDRTGVFFVVYNLFLEFLKQDVFDIAVYVAEDSKKDDVKRAVSLYGFPDVPVITQEELKKYHISVFFEPSSVTNAPVEIQNNPKLARYTILYDVTPLVLPDIEAPNADWFERLKSTLNGNDYYFCISEYTKKDFLRFFPVLNKEKVFATPLAASSSFFCCTDIDKINSVKEKYHIPQDKKYVFSLCTLQPRKNLIHAVKCFVDFVEENNIDDLYFVLGGGHWDAFIKQLDDAVDSEGKWKEHILKTGYIDDEDLAPLYSGALCTVYVSLYEGFGLPILEAMQCGCPVITSNTTSCAEVIGDTGIAVDPYDPVALRKAYKRMFTDNTFREKCKADGLARAATFSWNLCARKMLETMQTTYKLPQKKIKTKKTAKKRKPFGMERHKDLAILRFFTIPLMKKRYSQQATVFYALNIPVAKKKFGNTCDTVKILGISVKKTIHEGFEIREKYFGITKRIRPNYRNIDETVQKFSFAIANCFKGLETTENESLQKELEALPFYRLIKAVERGEVRLENEVKNIDEIVQKL